MEKTKDYKHDYFSNKKTIGNYIKKKETNIKGYFS
jgi:hypothetical protein